jgi:molybdopterin synthase catalytic subunit
MELSVDRDGLSSAVEAAREMPGVVQVRAWVNEGHLGVGDDIMYVLVGGDIREHVFDALMALVRTIKTTVVSETELRP